jgi:hypothetical protein
MTSNKIECAVLHTMCVVVFQLQKVSGGELSGELLLRD